MENLLNGSSATTYLIITIVSGTLLYFVGLLAVKMIALEFAEILAECKFKFETKYQSLKAAKNAKPKN